MRKRRGRDIRLDKDHQIKTLIDDASRHIRLSTVAHVMSYPWCM